VLDWNIVEKERKGIEMKINVIRYKDVKSDSHVWLEDEKWLFEQPDHCKQNVGMFNYWSEKKRARCQR
jgi:hypothetical protein